MDHHVPGNNAQAGFSLVELLASTLIMVLVSAAAFSVLSDVQLESAYQAEVQSVLSNSRIASEVVQHYIKQAGNNPAGAVLTGLTIVNDHEVNVQADLTGSSTTNPDKGDPDGDVNDYDENITLRHNANAATLEVILPDGTTRTAAGQVTGFTMQYLDETGTATTVGNDVTRVRATVTVSSARAHPKTGQRYAITQTFDLQLVSR